MSRRKADADTAPSQGKAASAAKPMNLKGVGMAAAVSKCVSVLYDEGGTELVAYRGVVVYAERTRCAPSPRALLCPHLPPPTATRFAARKKCRRPLPASLSPL